ncbi:hypothetical protein LI012_06465 [Caldibacillus thermoamylovorans]|uniref:hypothetical protein n=1 Tax=Caldibacillus thermoamylovorans TaxID=35841 RepID=UPI001D06B784|nr:hypothetical protein [Caldibacillus thermoamylovorans]MCB5934496.1 hypothetical protein [Bacillus sp. DFI.2.34]MCB7076471.1 hypothetical protein [Caldibacillus thermoamylovorans]
MIKGKTSSGFEYAIPEENLNNYELVEILGEIEENPLLISKVVKLLLGNEQAKKLKEHLRTKTGIVPMDKMSDEIMEIFESQKDTKNS